MQQLLNFPSPSPRLTTQDPELLTSSYPDLATSSPRLTHKAQGLLLALTLTESPTPK